MDWPTAENYEDVVESVRAFNQGLKERQGLEDQLSYFRAWYYIPKQDAVGPSKFIGYKGMTATEYMRSHSKVLDGRVTEPVLSQWFDVLDEETPENYYVKRKAESLVDQHNKTLSRKARFSAPRGWKVNKLSPTHQERVVQPEVHTTGPRPIVEVFWRAFISLYPEDQEALAQRILHYKRHEQ